MSKFAENLKYLRNEKNLTLKELSEKTSLSISGLHQWESEKRIPNADAVIILAQFFDVTTDYLLGLEK